MAIEARCIRTARGLSELRTTATAHGKFLRKCLGSEARPEPIFKPRASYQLFLVKYLWLQRGKERCFLCTDACDVHAIGSPPPIGVEAPYRNRLSNGALKGREQGVRGERRTINVHGFLVSR